MKFPTDRPVKVVMLGAGGTGGYVAPYVFRLLHMLDRPARFVVCDGDIVEPKNLDRQNFVPADLGENKARVLAERYSTVLGMETEYVPSFIEKLPDLMELIEPKEWELNPYSTKRTKEMVLLLGCVDNNTPMFFYPFSNVHSDDRVCTGNNVLPRYRKISALRNFPRYLLGLPDNDDMYDREHNRLKLSHGELLEHLKDKDPAYYYTDILVSNGKTLGDFISRR